MITEGGTPLPLLAHDTADGGAVHGVEVIGLQRDVEGRFPVARELVGGGVDRGEVRQRVGSKVLGQPAQVLGERGWIGTRRHPDLPTPLGELDVTRAMNQEAGVPSLDDDPLMVSPGDGHRRPGPLQLRGRGDEEPRPVEDVAALVVERSGVRRSVARPP